MRITPEIEQKLWAATGVARISEIPGFPFASHTALKEAVASGKAQLGIEYAAARDLVPIKSPQAAVLILSLTWVMPALAVASIVVALLTGNWWSLLGIVSSFLGQTLANPYNPLKVLGKVFVVAAILHIIASESITRGFTWVSFSFAASAIALWILNHLAWRWAHRAVLGAEVVAAHLFKTRNLHIRDDAEKMHNVED